MIKRPFFSLKQPRFEYQAVSGVPIKPVKIGTSKQVKLFLERPFDSKAPLSIKIGDPVNTGQKISPYEGKEEYVISSVTGTIGSISSFTGDFGMSYTAITINTQPEDVFDPAFGESIKENGADAGKDFLAYVPGNLPLNLFFDPEKHIDTVVICGVEKDLLITTNQYVMKSNVSNMNKGISVLKKMTGVHKVVIALPQGLVQEAGAVGGASGVELRVIDTGYPAASPKIIMRDVMGQVVPAGKSCEDMGISFISAEAVASIGKAFNDKTIPMTKTLTVIKKDMTSVMVEARIGTPIGLILKALDISLFDKDRIIIGGPMTGSAIYTEEYPVRPDTDAIMIQDSEDIPLISDYPCINCGECVRICPANVPVSMLVRFLEARKYEEAADEYDLHSCIECGLCSFVCSSKMPIFQYIKLAKYELEQIRIQEEASDD